MLGNMPKMTIGGIKGSMIALLILAGLASKVLQANEETADMLFDDFTSDRLITKVGTQWRGVSDQVMGGVSQAVVTHRNEAGRTFLRLSGDVRLDNNGGFIQAAANLAPSDNTFDASGFTGIRLEVRGNDEQYSLHLRTPDNTRPWQSYRAHFTAGPEWQIIELPFADFKPYRIDAPLDTNNLRRIGLVAIGRAFTADMSVSKVSFYR